MLIQQIQCKPELGRLLYLIKQMWHMFELSLTNLIMHIFVLLS